jgi:ergothioneine biosynthesis protein EgtB
MNWRTRQHAAAPLPDSALASRFAAIRKGTMALAAPLSEADAQVQSMPDASPTKWHLAHTTWFFETFVLERFEKNFKPHHPAYRVLFNSYYQGVGEQHPRAQRGLITRPGLDEVRAYRHAVDDRLLSLLRDAPSDVLALVELGLQHEQQHQELILTDLKHLLSCNPTDPVYRPQWPLARVTPLAPAWLNFDGRTAHIGHAGPGFAFDNESPRHAVLLRPYALANRLVTHGEWLAFMDDGGYDDARWWLAAGWDWRRLNAIEAPAYWRREGRRERRRDGERWTSFTLHGRVPIDAHTPIVHVSYFEADAYARWRADATLRRRVGMDRLGLRALPGLSRLGRRRRRIQRQVHGQPVRAARRLVRHTARAHPRQLPQLFPYRRALAVQRRALGPRSRLRSTSC